MPLAAAGTSGALWDAFAMTTDVAGRPVVPIDWHVIDGVPWGQVVALMDSHGANLHVRKQRLGIKNDRGDRLTCK